MLLHTRGIVFRSIKYSETSIISDIFTEEKGLRSFIMGGVRGPKAKTGSSLLQLTSLVDMISYFREDNEINRIKEIRPAVVYHSIPFDVKKSTVALFLAEMCRKTVRTAEENKPLFQYIFDAFCYLDETEEPISNFHLAFLMQLTSYLGFLPHGEYSEKKPVFDLQEGIFEEEKGVVKHYVDGELSQLFSAFINCPPAQSHLIPINRQQRRMLLNHVLDFYRLHIENMGTINSHVILETVFN